MGDPLSTIKRGFLMDFSFSDAKVVESLDKVPEDFRGLYEPGEDGKFVLSQDEKVKSAVSAVVKLNEALKISRMEAKGLKGKVTDLSALSQYGSSVEEIVAGVNAKMEELQAAATGSKDAKLNLDKIKQELAAAHSKDLGVKDKRIEALKGQLDKMLIENVAKSAISELKGDTELLMPHLVGHIQSVEEDGEFKVFVVDKDKERRYSGATGQPMTIKELVSEFKASDKFSKLFASEAPSGGGMNPRGGTKPKGMPQQKTELSATEKIAQGLRSKGK